MGVGHSLESLTLLWDGIPGAFVTDLTGTSLRRERKGILSPGAGVVSDRVGVLLTPL